MANKELKNNQLVERVYLLAQEIKKKNPTLSGTIDRSIIGLLEYEGNLSSITNKRLIKIKGVGEAILPYLARMFRGEKIENIAKDIPERHNNISMIRGEGINKRTNQGYIEDISKHIPGSNILAKRIVSDNEETYNSDGIWDNAVSNYERD